MVFLKHSKLLTFISLLFIFCVFFYKGIVLLDPDFGWHIKLGQLTSQNGISQEDPFSYTMPSFPFVDHEWITNILLAKAFFLLGKMPLALLYTLIAFLTLFLVLRRSYLVKGKKTKIDALLFVTLFILGACVIFPFFGVRPQVQSWLLFALFMNSILTEKTQSKAFYLLPLLILVWVNLHGSFAVGLVALFLVVVLKTLRQKKLWTRGLVVWLLCLAFSFFNPYGIKIWHEVWLQVSDTSLRWTIQEWRPAFFSFDISYLFLLVLSGILIKKYSKIFTFEEIGLNLFFFVQGFLSVRHVPLWLIIDLPMVYIALKEAYFEVRKIKFGKERFQKMISITLASFIVVFIINFLLQIVGPSKFTSESLFYPKKAINYLKENPTTGQILAPYNWGGYLIWKLPEKKVFIDGRMPSWRWEASIDGESNYVMEDYKNILNGNDDYKNHFAKYNIATVLWLKPVEPSIFGNLGNRILSFVSGKNGHEEKLNLIDALKKDGWNTVYEDEVSVIYQK